MSSSEFPNNKRQKTAKSSEKTEFAKVKACVPPGVNDEKLKSSCWDLTIDHKNIEFDLRRFKSGLLTPSGALRAHRNLVQFVSELPKAELHIHIEGSLTPLLAYNIAKRNSVSGPELAKLEVSGAAKRRQGFTSLFPFLVEYSNSSAVLQTEQDFYEMGYAYLVRASENRVVHAEIFFDPQSHCFYDVSGDIANPLMNPESSAHLAHNCGGAPYDPHGVGPPKLSFSTVFNGLVRALADGLELSPPVHAKLILSFLRDRSEEEAMAVLDLAKPFLVSGEIVAVGLDNREGPALLPDGTQVPGNPPLKFVRVYAQAKQLGLQLVAHAGEEGGAEYIRQARDSLGCARIDHGVLCLEDPLLVAQLVKDKVPLTICPCSNHRLQVIPRFFCGENPVRQLLAAGLHVTLNSDDPAFFFMGSVDAEGRAQPEHAEDMVYDGFLSSNYMRAVRDCGLSPDELVRLAVNSFEASFLSPEQKQSHIAQIVSYCATWDTIP